MKEAWTERRKPRQENEADGRTAFDVDYARVVHSSSFRRLQGKTQIHQGDSDVPRTRLTHSIEVAQIALGIAQRIKAANLDPIIQYMVSDHSLVQVIGLVHDLGHPCGGHAGEDALNACLPYEGNGQTIRILTKLESHTQGYGANLTRRTLLGTLKYPINYSNALEKSGKTRNEPLRRISGVPLIGPQHAPPKCYLDEEEDVVKWLLAPFADYSEIIRDERIKTFDASLMDLADDFAYSAADLDDAIAMDMMKREWIEEDVPSHLWEGLVEHQSSKSPSERGATTSAVSDIIDALMGGSYERRRQTGSIINYLLGGIEIVTDDRMKDPLYRYRIALESNRMKLVDALKECVFKRVIRASSVQLDRVRIQRMIIDTYDAMSYRPMHYLPEKHRKLYQESNQSERVVADYIAGMTDRFLAKTHATMFG